MGHDIDIDIDPERHGSQDFTRQGLEQEGFSGFSSFQELGASRLSEVPVKAGVYVVLIGSGTSPQFLPESVGGHFKGRDPTEAPARLSDEWVDGAEALYIGKAKHLRRRLREFVWHMAWASQSATKADGSSGSWRTRGTLWSPGKLRNGTPKRSNT